MRDVQMSKAYAWERTTFPRHTTENPLTPREARSLIQRVFDDVVTAGGYAPDAPAIKFTKRNGGASASWRQLNFTPRSITQHIALHEIAHALTFNMPILVSAQVGQQFKREPLPLYQHALRYFCDQGHGPRYVACFIALLERYAGVDGAKALQTARFFKYEGWGPWRVVVTEKGNDGRTRNHLQRQRVTKHASIKVDLAALAYWRNLLKRED